MLHYLSYHFCELSFKRLFPLTFQRESLVQAYELRRTSYSRKGFFAVQEENLQKHYVRILSRKKRNMNSSTTSQNKIIRLVVISDTHGCHDMLTPILPPGDILIHCGDFANKGNSQDVKDFVNWIASLTQYQEKYVIDGNHDRTLKKEKRIFKSKLPNDDAIDLKNIFGQQVDKVCLLQDDLIQTRDGIYIYGASWKSCELGNFPSSYTRNIRPDIFLSHLPPCLPRSITIPQVGKNLSDGWRISEELSHAVLSNRIPLCLCGHVHRYHGVVEVCHYQFQDSKEWRHENLEKSGFVNASSLQTQDLNPYMAPPIVIDFDTVQRIPVRIQY